MSAITINGKTYEADLSDLYIVRDLVDAVAGAKTIAEGGEITAVIAFAEQAMSAVTRAIGKENSQEAFGDKLVLSVILDAVNQIAAEVGPAYDKMLADLA